LERAEEALDLGYENYLFSGDYCFIEWPEKISHLLNFPKADIFITVEDEVRTIRTSYGERL
jgi:tRNA threonylcarbamoyladenosine biosynthesis protein TsaE